MDGVAFTVPTDEADFESYPPAVFALVPDLIDSRIFFDAFYYFHFPSVS